MYLKFTGQLADDHKIPVDILILTMENLQHMVYLLALQEENISFRKRERTPAHIKNKYPILCESLQAGSVDAAICIGNPDSELYAEEYISKMLESMNGILCEILNGSTEYLIKAFDNGVRRLKFIDLIKSMISRRTDGYNIKLFNADNVEIFDSNKIRTNINSIAQPCEKYKIYTTITGVMHKIDVQKK